MTSRQTLSALVAALLLTGVTVGAATAATQHKMHATDHARSSHMHAKSTASRGSSQDHMADRLNAQSLQRANGQSMQQPMQAPMGQPGMAKPGMGQPGMDQPGMGTAPGAAQ